MTVSLGKRIFRIFFLNSLISLFVVVVFVWFVFEDMEDALLKRDSKEELQMLRRDSYLARHHVWQYGSVIHFFQPPAWSDESDITIPKVFQGIPVPFSGEVKWADKIYHIYSYATEEGNYFLAKDVSEFEHRELLFALMLGVLCVIVLMLNFLLSLYANRRLVKPLHQLRCQIRRCVPGQSMTPIDEHYIDEQYIDEELVEIAKAFNWFMTEISVLIRRERTMISSAGHELKTPIAVISGAIQIMEQRGQLARDDAKTFGRIKQATQEMQENVETLLTLYRRSRLCSSVRMKVHCVLDELMDEIKFMSASEYHRIQKAWRSTGTPINSDVVLAKMLFRNLIRNALNHTKGPIRLTLTDTYLDILDQGSGLPVAVSQWIHAQPGTLPVQEGLGLYIVTLACEQLGWHLEVSPANEWQHGFRLFFQNGDLFETTENRRR